MTEQTETQSALTAVPSAHRPALSMRERPARGYLNLRGQPEQAAFMEAVRTVTGLDLPLTPNTMTMGQSLSAIWLAPNEWLLVTPPDDAVSLQTRLRAAFGNLFATATDVSSGYATLEIAGSQARALLARGCSVDLHPRVFGPGDSAQTLLAKADVILAQRDASPRFHVIVRRSMADYIWSWLDDAARDVGNGASLR